MNPRFLIYAAAAALAACGGSDTSLSAGATPAQRKLAATNTAQTDKACTSIGNFYWEIGDAGGALASGTGGNNPPGANTQMLIASASKWFYGAYLVQLRQGQLLPADVKSLTMRSGYTNLDYQSCIRTLRTVQDAETVDGCFHSGNNDQYDAQNDGRFFYNGGHFQKYADIDLGLGGDANAALHSAITSQIGTDIPFTYDSPQLAAGAKTSAAGYAVFLRKLLSNGLKMHDALGADAVCTNPSTCATAASTPVPQSESWHYSLAHWVEDDPTVGDGAFSSPGAFGFYPWIDRDKTTYGILARHVVSASAAFDSVDCGRLIRRAWFTAQPQ